MRRSLSGIQPSGKLHIGNYFGAVRQYIALQEECDAFYFIADYHAMTTVTNPDEMAANCHDVAAGLVALGLDREKATLFRQSDVPEVAELTWLLSVVTPVGLMERCHAYKDKVAQGTVASMGLFGYPILMAADILIYDSNVVPVGQDQKQHLEVTRDIAGSFNFQYDSPVFILPEPYILPDVAVVPGLDGRKMSKSYGNVIEIFGDAKETEKRIKRMKTDSTPVEEPKDPDTCSVFALFRLMASADEREEMAKRYREGGVGYGDVKKRIVELFFETFGEARERRQELESNPEMLREIYAEGGHRARAKAREVLERAREAAGIGRGL
ncbi:MAG: tryptophan--tRNA ligase [candidate division WS1 bacterium]|jgi:tryptophanyl-tRNA synthetase|nr:tryptophan--tRNA ligase [candidate division WS1 bacterium]